MSQKKPPPSSSPNWILPVLSSPNFFFCLFFCFTAPNGSWEVPQIRRRKGIRLWCLKHSRRKLMKEAYLDSRKEAGKPEREKRAWWMLLWIVAFRLVVGLGGARGWGVGLADDKRKISFWKVPLSFLFLLKAFFPRWYRTHTHTHTHTADNLLWPFLFARTILKMQKVGISYAYLLRADTSRQTDSRLNCCLNT